MAATNTERRRVATRGDELIRGVGVVSDRNGPFTLRFRIDGTTDAITLDTRQWRLHWEDSYQSVGESPRG